MDKPSSKLGLIRTKRNIFALDNKGIHPESFHGKAWYVIGIFTHRGFTFSQATHDYKKQMSTCYKIHTGTQPLLSGPVQQRALCKTYDYLTSLTIFVEEEVIMPLIPL